ncbi:MAG: hypothetical protein KAQ83_03925 [Nanoarchaeota archaeon]|nr:hypothetical protein [Nanoarchaeota archaeon]
MISEFNQINELFKEMGEIIDSPINIFVIGGAVLLYQGLKPVTKDIDIVVETKLEFLNLQKFLKKIDFKTEIPGKDYNHMNLSQIFKRDDFRIDLFQKNVCGGFSLSDGMIKRGNLILDLNNLKVFLVSNEDIFLFKTMTEREGDLEDCISLAKGGLNWDIVLEELQNQINLSKKDVWITWIGERMDLLVDKGLVIPIMKKLDKLRGNFFDALEKSLEENK